LAGLRKRVGPKQAEPPWSPLRSRITAPLSPDKPETT
jgi:hypothetical protein